MKEFCESLREHTTKIINFIKKKIKLLAKEQQKSYENKNIFYIYKEKCENEYLKDKRYGKVRDHCHYTGEYRGQAHIICNLKDSVPKKIHNRSNYDYYFIIRTFAEEFKKRFTCLEEKTEKYIIFTVPIEKDFTRIDKDGEEIRKNIIIY